MFWFWQIFGEALEKFSSCFIQSKTSTSAHEYSESCRANTFAMLLFNFPVSLNSRKRDVAIIWHLFPLPPTNMGPKEGWTSVEDGEGGSQLGGETRLHPKPFLTIKRDSRGYIKAES